MSIASAWVGLTLPGMIDEPGSLAGSTSSRRPVRGPDPSQRMSLANLEQRDRGVLQGRVCAHHAVQRPLRGELVRRRRERLAGELGQGRGHLLAETGRRVEPGTDRGAAHRDCQQPLGRVRELGMRVLERPDVARPFLPDGQRRGVFEVRASDFDDLGPLVGLGLGSVGSRRMAGMVLFMAMAYAAMCIAVGKVSLLDCAMFTWSLGWTGSWSRAARRPAGCTGSRPPR